MALKKSSISIIHVAKNQLGMDDDSYRMMLKRLTNKASSKELTEREFSRVMAEFRAKGFIERINPKSKGKPHNFNSLGEMVKKVEALLADMKLDWDYANGISKQMFGIHRIEWLTTKDQFKAIIAALDKKRKKLKEAE